MGRLAQGQGPPAAGFEPSAQRLGEPAQLVEGAGWVAIGQGHAIRVAGPIELRLAAAERGDLVGPAGLTASSRQPRQGPGLARNLLQPPLQRRLLGVRVAQPSRQPGAERQHRLGLQGLGRQVPHRLDRLIEPVRRHRPLQPGLPDRRVLGAALQASLQPRIGLGEPGRAGRQVGLAQPDAVVLGRRATRLLQPGPQRIDGIRPRIVDQEMLLKDLGLVPRSAHSVLDSAAAGRRTAP